MNVGEILDRLRDVSNPGNLPGMARYGINTENALGVSIPLLRKLAKQIGRDQALAEKLWNTGVHEARILAGFIGEPDRIGPRMMDAWARDFDSWDLCDQVCSNLFDRTPHAYEKAFEWAEEEAEFLRRAGFTLMAALAVHDKQASNEKLALFLPAIERHAGDDRNFAKKAVNWALRNIGKRNLDLNALAVETAERILAQDTKSARWIARDALRELTSGKVRERLKD